MKYYVIQTGEIKSPRFNVKRHLVLESVRSYFVSFFADRPLDFLPSTHNSSSSSKKTAGFHVLWSSAPRAHFLLPFTHLRQQQQQQQQQQENARFVLWSSALSAPRAHCLPRTHFLRENLPSSYLGPSGPGNRRGIRSPLKVLQIN